MNPKEEEKLIKQAKAVKSGENVPFGKLYRNYHPKVKGYLLARVADERKAEDLTARVFEKALAGLPGFHWQGVPFSAWLFKIARNTLFDSFRAEKGKRRVSIEDLPHLETKDAGPEEIAARSEGFEILEEALLRLPEREKEIVYMKFYEGCTNRAIAKHTGLSETNVGTILYRTLRKLRKELAQ
jgi:RNA polymerase sigma factor (sigma-70 family)